ncbi:MAG: M20 family metallopeptidase, partial [Chloroflexi bacterium]|nr:M20 family metallopeptidase [Chloroflexota bacterium]
MSDLLPYFQNQQQQMIDLLTTLVNYETPTRQKAAVDQLGAFMETQFRDLGASSVTRIPQTEVGDFLLAKWNEHAPGQPIMFLIHIDTVWPLGTLAERPVRIEDDGRLYGPGAIDMKGGITEVLAALRGLRERNELPERPVWVLMTSDEEIGSVYAKPAIKEYAQRVGLVLVMEPATIHEEIKTFRKGIATYRIDIEGLPSHAGNAPEKGLNAIIEFAQQALRLNELNDLRNGTSVSVTMVAGGSAANVIPAHVTAHVDTRAATVRDWEAIRDQITHLQPFIPGVKISVSQVNSHMPMENDAAMQQRFAQVKAIGERHGLTVREA